jgi:uncharacterized membrane protein YhaH (DUF805 family)
MSWYLKVLKQYADFRGRARRREFWWFALIHLLLICLLVIVELTLGLGDPVRRLGLLSGLYVVGAAVPGLAVTVRRLHDWGRTGWWVLIAVIPVLGVIALLVLMLIDSQPGDNEYGPNPKLAA